MTLKGRTYFFIVACAICFGSCAASSGDEHNNNDHLPSFFSANYNEQILEISLTFDLDSLIERKKEEDEIRAYIEIPSMGNNSIPLKISARGVNRKESCIFPPLRLNFSKEILNLNGWNDYDKYKLVTHCLGAQFEDELLLREYLIYKIYEQVSEISFRTQLLKVKYIMPTDTESHHAFILENEKELAERLGMNYLDIKETSLNNIHFEQYKKFVLFQYMIGNTDWNLNSGHNTRYVLKNETETPIVIPYDFDNSGLVNAPYAKPYPSMPIEHVRERYFMYRGKKDDDFDAIKNEFVGKKSKIFSTIQDFPFLAQSAKADMISYLQEFYEVLETDNWKTTVFLN